MKRIAKFTLFVVVAIPLTALLFITPKRGRTATNRVLDWLCA